MKNFKENVAQIYQNERFMFILMIINLLLSIALLIYSLVTLNPGSAVVKIGYGDIGGYRDGSWFDMLSFSILAIILGVFHNFIAVRIFQKRGAGMTKFFVITTTVLIIGTFIVLFRILKEG